MGDQKIPFSFSTEDQLYIYCKTECRESEIIDLLVHLKTWGKIYIKFEYLELDLPVHLRTWFISNCTFDDLGYDLLMHIVKISDLFITITGYVGVIPPQGPPASPHQGCQGPPYFHNMQNFIQYTIYILVCISLYKFL